MTDELTRDELLILLIEECGEVIQAATKCLRFGYNGHHPPYGINSEVLAQEIGDVMGVIDNLNPDLSIMMLARSSKMRKALIAKKLYGSAKTDGTRTEYG